MITRSLVIVLLLAGAASLASADVIVITINDSLGTPIPESAPYATATFTLNPDKTIGVDVTAESGLLITWFGFNRPAGTTSSDITPAPVYIGPQITSGFDDANDGFCLSGTGCFNDFLTDNFFKEPSPFGTSDLSFKLSRAGGFTSLTDLINTASGGTCCPAFADNVVGVVLTDDRSVAQKYAAIGTAVVVPEPSSILLFVSGVAILATRTNVKRFRRTRGRRAPPGDCPRAS